MNTTDCIDRNGIVEEVGIKSLRVRLTQASCCGCSSKSICSSGKQELIVDVTGSYPSVSIGDEVIVRMPQKTGYKAIFFGYFLPFIILMFTLILTTFNHTTELFAGIVSIFVLIPYFLILYFFRRKIKSSFSLYLIEN